MKTKQLFLSLLVLLTSSSAYAYDFELNGIYYNTTGQNTVEVTYVENGSGNADFYYGDVIIPQSIVRNGVTYSVTSIGRSAFSSCSGLTSIVIPNSVTSIGDGAFVDCSGLTSIEIPNSVTSIGSRAFAWCPSLTSIVVNSGNSTFDSRNDCNAIIETASNELIVGCKTTVIPNSVTSIGYSAFRGSGLTSIEIPNSVTSIGGHAFAGCSGLTSIVIPNSVTSIGENAFYNCPGLTSVTVDLKTPLFINWATFTNCANATLYVPVGCKAAYEAAEYWKDFKEIREFISAISFADGNVKAICVANWDMNGDGELSPAEASAVTSLSTVFKSNTQITSFDELRYFTGLTSIGLEAFYGCSGLTSIEIPNSVTSIGQEAFSGCSGLTSVTVDLKTPLSIDESTFTNRANATLYVPAGCKAAYEAAEYWKDFKEIVEMNITFADEAVKAICVRNWDTDGDGELSPAEASAVTSLSTVFKSNTRITSFDELRYFTGLTSIGLEAFDGCRGLTSIVIPNSVTRIAGYAFRYCSGLTSIVIPNSVTRIAEQAFYNCSGLTSIVIPNSVTSIGSHAFYGCRGLTSIVVNSGNSTFDSRNDCNAIIETASNKLIVGCKNTVIPNSVTSIGDNAFASCSGLTSIEIPNSVTSIAGYAFDGCSGLTSIEIPNSVTSIGYGAFNNCSSLTSVFVKWNAPLENLQLNGVARNQVTLYVPAGSKTAYEEANYWMDFMEIREFISAISFADGNVKAICVANWDTNGDGELDEDEAAAVTELGQVFRYNVNITSFDELRYFTGLTSIGSRAFYSCSGLTSIVIPNSVTSIGDYAFYHCSGLTSIEIPNSVTRIGYSAFCGCSGLTSIVIPNSVTSIGQYAFSSCSGLTSIVIPNSVTSIGYRAFSSSGLTSIVVNSGNSTFDSRNDCNAIIETASNKLIVGCKTTVIPNSVTSIAGYAFADCSGLTSIEIPNSVTSIGQEAFYGCSGLTSIEIPNSVKSIGQYAFYGCFGLTSIVIPNSVTSIGRSAFAYCSGLTSIVIPNSVTSIGRSAFACCSGLTSIVIPNSVTSIGGLAFNNCSSLTSIEIPNSVTSIGESAFYGCSGLTSMTVDLKTPLSIDESTFTNRANATLYVPAGCKAAYEAAEYWKDFKEIVEMTAPDTDITEMDNVIYVEAVGGFAGGTVKLDIKVKNVLSPVGCSFKLTLPDGFTLEKDADGDVVYVLGDRARKMSLTMQDWNNGAYDCALTPTTATAGINGSDGAILTFSVRVPDNATAGEFKMHLTRNLIQTKTEGSVRDNVLPDVQTTLTIHDCIPGDVNDDGSVTPSDAIMILYRYFGVEQSGFKQIAADVNSDNNISPADAIEVLYKYFASTQANAPAMTVDTLDPQ